MTTEIKEKTVPLALTEVEKDMLLAILKAELTDTVEEARRTDNPNYKDGVLLHEGIMKELIKRIEILHFDV